MAQYAARLRYDELPDRVVRAAQRCLVDALACAVGAVNERAARLLRAGLKGRPAREQATILGTGERTDTENAALVGCTQVRDLDANDLYAGPPGRDTGHFSDALPAVLAEAEASGADGRELLTCVVAVYELQAVLADAYLWMERGLHSVSQVGWALPAVVGRLRGFGDQQIVNAIGLSGSMSGLVLQSWLGAGSIPDIKAVSTGMVAAGAIRAADLAAQGITAPSRALETLFERLPSDPRPEAFDRLAERAPGVSAPWAVERMIFKRYPAQIYVQAAIEAALAVRSKLDGADPSSIERIVLEGHERVAAGVQGRSEAFHPANRGDADHSTPFAVAMALRDGELTAASYHGEPWKHEQVLRLMDRVELVVDVELDRAATEDGRFGCRLTVTTDGGQEVSASVTQQRGHPDQPLTEEELRAKARSLVDPVLGRGAADRLWGEVADLPDAASVAPLLAACALPETTPQESDA